MSALNRFETLMESLVERGFARILRTRMQPIEIAKRLSREMELRRTVAINRVLVPNHYMVSLSTTDYENFASIQVFLQKEIATYLLEYATEHKYTMPSEPVVLFEQDTTLRAGGLRIAVRMEESEEEPPVRTAPLQPTQLMPSAAPASPAKVKSVVNERPRIELQGAVCYLDRTVATIGRGLQNDVIVEDARVSRQHARMQRGLRGWELADLASTNGTFVNGRPIKQRYITHGDTISLGGLEMKFYTDAP